MAGYDYSQYCHMIADASRMGPHLRALEKAVTNESVVLDLGAGTGFMSLQACRFGARKVYSIEGNPLISVAKSLAAKCGYADRIEFFQAVSKEVDLPEKVDLIVCDLRGVMPLAGSSVPDIIDARDRFLKPDGIMIAERDIIHFALGTASDFYNETISRYLDKFYEIDLSSNGYLLTNRMLAAPAARVELASEPRVFAEIDYGRVETGDFSAQLEWEIDREAVLHGLFGWFDIDLGFGEKITTSQSNPGHVWGNPFFPFEEPLRVTPGDKVKVEIRAFINDTFYEWSWNTMLFAAPDLAEPTLSFQQSTWFGSMTVPIDIKKRSEFFLPKPNEVAELNKLFLNSMGDEVMVGDIADKLLADFPEKFETFDEAMQVAADLSQQYSK